MPSKKANKAVPQKKAPSYDELQSKLVKLRKARMASTDTEEIRRISRAMDKLKRKMRKWLKGSERTTADRLQAASRPKKGKR